ncbi:Oidioi.mRNA.OKI2018_I69.chr1.g1484.t1.cds [Oikopleura dioica]|uniref:Oidioi.mRNA.OKI2018_I69.chr1.g1484.t1.cds n=1 Tax=Oikopleura dioica TaxID=34765 RepID=A0ABN7SV13_OIKDI|nr:Oidioi.mRNA.OKI2018_I69.chr1.g1484.t1.cds [Oikopleura dioica]
MMSTGKWKELEPHPRYIEDLAVVSLPSGALLTIGGKDRKPWQDTNEIWQLMNNNWSLHGFLPKLVTFPSVLMIADSIFVFPGDMTTEVRLIQRINLDSNENIVFTNVVGEVPKDSGEKPLPKIEEDIVPKNEGTPLEMGKRHNLAPIKEENEPPDAPKREPLANVKCLECHCVGTVMKTKDEVVLRPNTVKKTLIDLGGGLFMPNINKVKPTVKIINQKAKDFVEGFNETIDGGDENRENAGFFQRSTKRVRTFRARFARGMENARPEKKMKLAKMIQAEMVKTPAPEKFTGWFSDEFEKHAFWKSEKRFSLHGNKTMRQLAVYMVFGCFFWGIIVGISITF